MDGDTGQTLISGMGELHLEVLVDRMLREFKVQARVGRPRVAYKESITRRVEKVDYRHVKQTGGHGQYGHVVLDMEPGQDGSGIVFEDEIRGGTIPREYIPAVEKGVRCCCGIWCAGWLSGNRCKSDPGGWIFPRGGFQ